MSSTGLVNRGKLLERMKFCAALCEHSYHEQFNKQRSRYDTLTIYDKNVEGIDFFGGPSIMLHTEQENVDSSDDNICVDDNIYVTQGFSGYIDDETSKRTMYIVFRGTDSPLPLFSNNWWFDWKYNFLPTFQKLDHVIDKVDQKRILQKLIDPKIEEAKELDKSLVRHIIEQREILHDQAYSRINPIMRKDKAKEKIEKIIKAKTKKQTDKIVKKAKIHGKYWWQYAEDRGELENKKEENERDPNCKTVQTQIQELFNRDEFKNVDEIIITGHSLGGAIALLCAWDIFYKQDRKVSCFTFGNPRAGNKYFSKLMRICVPDIHRVVYSNDPVPKYPMLPWRFRHTGISYHVGPKESIPLLEIKDGKVKLSMKRFEHHGMYFKFFNEIKKWEDLNASIIESDYIEYKSISKPSTW